MLIEKTIYEGRYNLIDDDFDKNDESRFICQMDIANVKKLGKSIIDLLKQKP